jgi:hypothetical protein
MAMIVSRGPGSVYTDNLVQPSRHTVPSSSFCSKAFRPKIPTTLYTSIHTSIHTKYIQKVLNIGRRLLTYIFIKV